ncbi:hypothetical protein NDU88_002694 [Pleurodeles waltl]|uniref:Uncharacterized protein n=1 Tax=Pleurodeles waltl TaxID=8319 RepID=A0AAV7PCE9_PLEWA|nr:hypothetical protein NDU88_002694 [Pleurodeles waltl]
MANIMPQQGGWMQDLVWPGGLAACGGVGHRPFAIPMLRTAEGTVGDKQVITGEKCDRKLTDDDDVDTPMCSLQVCGTELLAMADFSFPETIIAE